MAIEPGHELNPLKNREIERVEEWSAATPSLSLKSSCPGRSALISKFGLNLNSEIEWPQKNTKNAKREARMDGRLENNRPVFSFRISLSFFVLLAFSCGQLRSSR